MKLLLLETEEEIEADIVQVEENDYELIKQSGQYLFDWSQESHNHVYKLIQSEEEETEIQGLISFQDIFEELRIHVNLLEISNDNKSPDKKFDNVAGCLLAFAAQTAFTKGYNGFTSLIPKTSLIPLYVKKYGFTQVGHQLAIEGKSAITLIQKYE